MFAGGFGCSSFFSGAFPVAPGFTGSSPKAGPAPSASGINSAAATAQAILFEADTIENVHARSTDPNPAPPFTPLRPPGRGRAGAHGDTEPMKLSRRVSWFLLAFGVWSWFIWVTFVKNLWNDGSGLAFDDAGDPTAYFWVHLLLAVTSFVLGTVIGVIGLRGVRASRRSVD
ncbi:hypothetical protein SNE510_42760 [Streptomyces sp. NE5-10]|nr:hypothetical protein SNE510_42760 [Streptomyces sp. NE5-10]